MFRPRTFDEEEREGYPTMQRTLLRDSVVKVAKEQVACDLAGEAVILSLKSGQYFGLNEVGARVWNLIQEPKTVKEIRDTLLKEYDVESECCERELLALLQDLAAKGLVVVKDEKAP
jgi:Coenzyme PQQ synthesis protein D (PqqD)